MTILLYTLITTHITILCVTLFLHRGQAHRGFVFHSSLSHFMRFWLWLTTGMVTKEWVAIHRKHHQMTDKPGDPHSPHLFGIKKVLLEGALLYNNAAKDTAMIEHYGVGTPDDWMEKNVYTPHSTLGISLLLAINMLLFGYWGVLVWVIQMLWIPFWAAGVINGLGHWRGYRNTDTKDHSTNIVRIGVVVGGEELHNNHHAEPANPKFSRNPNEFDIGWMYFNIFRFLGLAWLRD